MRSLCSWINNVYREYISLPHSNIEDHGGNFAKKHELANAWFSVRCGKASSVSKRNFQGFLPQKKNARISRGAFPPKEKPPSNKTLVEYKILIISNTVLTSDR